AATDGGSCAARAGAAAYNAPATISIEETKRGIARGLAAVRDCMDISGGNGVECGQGRHNKWRNM
ncbi:MAG: hypothetical protein ACN6PB_18515, partial [Achromobacter kerstersii]|uniref:hypothetical protein n=1 Tax=Achromobacter kerstersii TaxID=1353890 RepID=UPI003CFC8624